MDSPEYLTPDEARAQGVRWRPRLAAPTQRAKERERLQAAHVQLPDLRMVGWSGWLCHVCRRVPLPRQAPWSWFGCEACRAVDRRAASLFGGERILPLGQHSMMNGLGIRLSTAAGPGLEAAFEQFAALGRGWDDLSAWAEVEAERLVASVADLGVRTDELVPLPTWQEWFPPGRPASADAFVRLIARQQPWLVDMEPRLGDVAWLAERQP